MSMVGKNLVGPDPTLLPDDPEVAARIAAGDEPEDLAASFPASSLAWAMLAEDAWGEGRVVDSYAYARVGYHRGLDALRKAGWRGQGPVPWAHEPNRGVLRSFFALRRAAAEIGEDAEVERLTALLDDADPRAAAEIEAGIRD